MKRSRGLPFLLASLAAVLLIVALLLLAALPAAAQTQGAEAYRSVLGLPSRTVVWVVGQLHVMFGAFVLGVPVFAVILEVVGTRNGDPRYDRLARECTHLLAAAFATTAAFGGLLTFVLFGLYPGVMQHIGRAMHGSFYIYGLLFFVEAFTLYYYYYSWDRLSSPAPRRPRMAKILRIPAWILGAVFAALFFYLFLWNGDAALASLGPSPAQVAAGASRASVVPPLYHHFAWIAAAFLVVYALYAWSASRKSFHLYFGVVLNLTGIVLMMIANSWGTLMMSPTTFDASGTYVGDTWGAVSNYLWRPLNLHRVMGNVTFGGFVVAAYAAVRFLLARRQEDRAYYDWMGYVGNFVGIAGLLALPFAGYYLGRELYSFSAVMGNDAMGGFLSWNFVVQAFLIGLLFVGANFYLWSGMERIEGAERYRPWVKVILAGLVCCFIVWVVPRNLPLDPAEQVRIGAQYHPVLKYLGLMPAKNAAINFILLSTYWSFMLYRRANKEEAGPLGQAKVARLAVPAVAVVTCALVGAWAFVIFTLSPSELTLEQSVRPLLHFHGWVMVAHIAVQVAAVVLAFRGRGKLGQVMLLGLTAAAATGLFGASGFEVMRVANPFLRHLAVAQFVMVLSSMILTTAIDVALFRGGRTVGRIRWGAIGARPQYALVLLCVTVVLTMGLMGYIHSGVRQDWHFYGTVRDTSISAQNPNLAEVGWTVAGITIVYLSLIAFLFWLGTLGHQRKEAAP